MLRRTENTNAPYSEAQATAWLAWLARGMQQHTQTVFLIEQLQPSWLRSRAERWAYTLVSRLIRELWIGGIYGLVLGLFFEVPNAAIEPLVVGLVVGLIAGLVVGLIDASRLEGSSWWTWLRKWPAYWQGMIYFVGVALIEGLIYGVLFGLAYGVMFGLVYGLLPALAFGLAMGLVWGHRMNRPSYTCDIQPVETLTFSWAGAGRAGILGIGFGLIGCLVLRLGGLTLGFPDVLAVVTLGGAVFALAGSLRPGVVELKTVPNQGIRLTLRNAVLAGLQFAVVFGPILRVTQRPAALPGSALFFAPVGGSIYALWGGGRDVIQHYTLRAMLYATGCAPWNYARFLDYAANELGFLQKVGGGYMFIHRMLLEHFAALPDHAAMNQPATSNIATSARQE